MQQTVMPSFCRFPEALASLLRDNVHSLTALLLTNPGPVAPSDSYRQGGHGYNTNKIGQESRPENPERNSMFSKAIVRTPGRSLIAGLTAAKLGTPDYRTALEQHRHYIAALEHCGLDVLVLESDEAYPDSTFVEDVAILTPHCAIITRPAAASRRGETESILPVLEEFYASIEKIKPPGTLDGGDVMQIEQHFYIGLSERTNRSGADQLIDILKAYGLTGSVVPVREFLHLKTGVTLVAEKTLLAAGEFIAQPEFSGFRILPVAEADKGGANCIRINDKLLVAAGFPEIRKQLGDQGDEIIDVDISEFAKLDGGLTCLSLRF